MVTITPVELEVRPQYEETFRNFEEGTIIEGGVVAAPRVVGPAHQPDPASGLAAQERPVGDDVAASARELDLLNRDRQEAETRILFAAALAGPGSG